MTTAFTARDAWILGQNMSTEEAQDIIMQDVGKHGLWNAIVNCFSLARIVDFMKSGSIMNVLSFLNEQNRNNTLPSYTRPFDIFADEAIRRMDDTHIPVLNRLCFEFIAALHSNIAALHSNKLVHDIEFIFEGIRQHETMPIFFPSLDKVSDLLKARLKTYTEKWHYYEWPVPALIHYISPYILESELFWQMVSAYVSGSKRTDQWEQNDLLKLLFADCKTKRDKEEQEAAIGMCIQQWFTNRHATEYWCERLRKICTSSELHAMQEVDFMDCLRSHLNFQNASYSSRQFWKDCSNFFDCSVFVFLTTSSISKYGKEWKEESPSFKQVGSLNHTHFPVNIYIPPCVCKAWREHFVITAPTHLRFQKTTNTLQLCKQVSLSGIDFRPMYERTTEYEQLLDLNPIFGTVVDDSRSLIFSNCIPDDVANKYRRNNVYLDVEPCCIADCPIYDSYVTIPIESRMRKNVQYLFVSVWNIFPSDDVFGRKKHRLQKSSPAKFSLKINMELVPIDIDELHILCDSTWHHSDFDISRWKVSVRCTKTPDDVVYVSIPSTTLAEDGTVQQILAADNSHTV